MQGEKALLQQWKKDLQIVKEEKRKKKRRRKKDQSSMNSTKLFEYMSQQRIYYKNNGVWKQQNR